ncbi:MAG TPA: hypothetical protein VF135_04255 [Terriglobales bacterium]
MLRRCLTTATIIVALTGASLVTSVEAQSSAPAAGKAKSKVNAKALRGKKSKSTKTVEVPPPPPPPPTPEQQPSVAPQVLYRDGLLTINAPNSTMNDVLAAVRRVTGATIEKPPIGGNDRVVATLGPGQPKDVLQALFNGSRYDYIILGPMNHPGGVQRVILTARSNVGTQAAGSSPVQPPSQANVPQQNPDDEETEPETEDMTIPERDQAEPEQPQPDQQQPQGMPMQPPQEQSQQPQQNPDQQNSDQQNQQRVKSPEELLRELQQMQKQAPDQNQQQQQQPEQQPPQ